jgi:hypothetical protein
MATLWVKIPIKSDAEWDRLVAAFKTLGEVGGMSPSVEDELRLCDATDLLAGLAEHFAPGKAYVVHRESDNETWE